MVIEAGAAGEVSNVLVRAADLFTEYPQVDAYATLTLSPADAALLLENFTRITCEVNVPESTTALVPSVPINDHCHPVAATDVVVAATNAGAAYLYNFPPQTFVMIGVIAMDDGAAGAEINVLMSLAAFLTLKPHPEKALTLTLSALVAAALDKILTLMTLEKLASPESTYTPVVPPTDDGKDHM